MSVRLLLVAAGCLSWAGCAHKSAEVVAPPPHPPVEKAPPAEIVIPRREGAPRVLVLPAQVIGAPLLPSEVTRPRREVARQLALQTEHPLDVMPLEEVDVVNALAQSGQAHPEGPKCATTPSLDQALARTHPTVLRAQPTFDCAEATCRVTVTLFEPAAAGGERKAVATWRAAVESPDSPEGWEKAAQAMQKQGKAADVVEPPLNPEVHRSPFVTLVSSRPFGPWPSSPPAQAFQQAARAFDACHAKGRVSRGTETLVVSYAPGGAASACVLHTHREPSVPELEACLCRAATQVQVGEGPEGRRIVLEARAHNELGHTTDDGERISAVVSDFQSSDPVLTEDRVAPTLPWLALCYSSTKLERNISVPIRLTVAPRGEVSQVEILGEGSSQVLAPCVAGYLEHHAFPCTSTDAPASLSFTLKLDRTSQNVPTSAAPLPEGTSWTLTSGSSAR